MDRHLVSPLHTKVPEWENETAKAEAASIEAAKRNPAAPRSVISVLEPLANDKHGTWTLHIPDLTKGSGWTFRFSV